MHNGKNEKIGAIQHKSTELITAVLDGYVLTIVDVVAWHRGQYSPVTACLVGIIKSPSSSTYVGIASELTTTTAPGWAITEVAENGTTTAREEEGTASW